MGSVLVWKTSHNVGISNLLDTLDRIGDEGIRHWGIIGTFTNSNRPTESRA